MPPINEGICIQEYLVHLILAPLLRRFVHNSIFYLCSTSISSGFDNSLKSNVINISADGKIEGLPSSLYLTQPSDSSSVNVCTTSQPTAKVTKNSLTQRTQIQIPTSTLQTILKSGRLMSRIFKCIWLVKNCKHCEGQTNVVRFPLGA